MWYGEARLGPERVKGLYAFRSIMNSGARITLGSDIPVECINPLDVRIFCLCFWLLLLVADILNFQCSIMNPYNIDHLVIFT